MAIETRPNTNPELPDESPYETLMAYGKERGYKLDWLQLPDSLGSHPDIGDSDSGGFLLQNADLGPFSQVAEECLHDRVR